MKSASALWALALLLVLLQGVFWKQQVFDAPTRTELAWSSADLFIEHVPNLSYASHSLREGRLPLWNPHQLCGVPFLALPTSGVFYPPNAVYLLLPTLWAVEVSVMMHLALAALGSFALARTLGASRLGALAAGLSYGWSGYLVGLVQIPAWLLGASWIPLLLLAVELTLRRVRLAAAGLALVVAFELLSGAPEAASFGLAAAGLFAAYRLAQGAASRGARDAAVGAAVLLAAVACGAALAAPQLLPTLAVAEQSVRASGSLTLEQARAFGTLAPAALARQFLAGVHAGRAGVLPLLGLVLGVGAAGLRGVWAYAVVLGGGAALLAGGGSAFELYFDTPLGGLFRRPIKFLVLVQLACALLSAVAVTRLGQLARLPRAALWKRSEWWALGLVLLAAAAWAGSRLQATHSPWPWLVAAWGIFGAVRSAPPRLVLTAAAVGLQGALLFVSGAQEQRRPLVQAERFERFAPLLDELGRRAGDARIYLSAGFHWEPGLMAKQGMLRRLPATASYEALPSRRQADFFRLAAGPGPRPLAEFQDTAGFEGWFLPGRRSRWDWLDWTATRFYLTRPGEALDRLLDGYSQRSQGFRRLELPGLDDGEVHVYERPQAGPRAWFAPVALPAADAEAAFARLESRPPGAARAEVVIEVPPGLPPPVSGKPGLRGSAQIVELSPERVEIEVDAEGPGFLVLADSFAPGWSARSEQGPLRVYAANGLFRAVPVPAGRTRVHFEYRAPGLAAGLWLALLGAAGCALLGRWAPAAGRRSDSIEPGVREDTDR